MELLDFQEQWKQLVDKAVSDFNALSKDERVWFTIEALIGDVDNGGIISHYYNNGATYNAETIEDLESLGFPDLSTLLKRINNYFPKGIVPADIDERNDIIETFSVEEFDVLLSEFDNIFYDREEALEKRLVEHILTTLA
ncbi:DUF4375 domain-containing protein [Parabacteroides sp. FAFU027]|uniref:DMP19 family protein n=1 Tax=Parabacteroides sp. FAFU027 TaxID=2922715 RepID=UPI001FAFCF73|nr:DUF4375 domain-containing protein [Parabacteroides sp. FAFU027]